MTPSDDVHKRIEDIRKDLSARVEVQAVSSRSGRCAIDGDWGEQSYTEYLDEDGMVLYTDYEYDVPRGVSNIGRRGETKPDISTRLNAVKQAGQLHREGVGDLKDLLLATYQSNDVRQVRTQAGKELGYSGLRIWVHEHPVTATITGIGVASGSIYALIEYLGN